jgi:hypothetical protein
MLRTNLATRPFYNERFVHVLLGVAFALVAALTVFNVTRLAGLSSKQSALAAEASRDERRAADLTSRAAAIRRSIDPKALARVTDAAIEANALIDARAFSWTALFNDIESTLPATVMLTSISPSVSKDREGVLVRFIVIGRTVEGIDTFIEKLEGTGRFHHVIAPAEEFTDDGLYRTTIEGTYLQTAAPPADAPAAAPAAAPKTASTAAKERGTR